MDGDRLLTPQEFHEAVAKAQTLESLRERALFPLVRQDQKTAAQVKAATLRAVGEELATRPKYQGFGRLAVAVSLEEIEALLAGKTPAGWEKE